MSKNDLLKTKDGIFRVLSICTDKVLAIDCTNTTMPKYFPHTYFENAETVASLPTDFPAMDDLSPSDRKTAQERYTMIAGAVAVVEDKQKRNLMIETAAQRFSISKQSIRSYLCSYLVCQDIAVLAPKHSGYFIAANSNNVLMTVSENAFRSSSENIAANTSGFVIIHPISFLLE